jgi:hypothetical protein
MKLTLELNLDAFVIFRVVIGREVSVWGTLHIYDGASIWIFVQCLFVALYVEAFPRYFHPDFDYSP